MTYTGVVFSIKSGFKKIVLTQGLILVLNWLPAANGPPGKNTKAGVGVRQPTGQAHQARQLQY